MLLWKRALGWRWGQYWPVLLVVLPVVLGIPEWVSHPAWIRPTLLGVLTVTAVYGLLRTEHEQAERTRNDLLAFGHEAGRRFREEGRRLLEGFQEEIARRDEETARRDRDAAEEALGTTADEVAALKEEIRDLER